jgi:hypothetical protein
LAAMNLVAIKMPFGHPKNLVTKILVAIRIWLPNFWSPQEFDHHTFSITTKFGCHRNLVATNFSHHMFQSPHISITIGFITTFLVTNFGLPTFPLLTILGQHYFQH